MEANVENSARLVLKCNKYSNKTPAISRNNPRFWLKDLISGGGSKGLKTEEARVARGYASSNSYASFVLSKLPACFISR